jgi:hypothetical protein
VARGAGASDSRPLRRVWHGVANASTGLEPTLALFVARRCESKNSADPEIAIGPAIG